MDKKLKLLISIVFLAFLSLFLYQNSGYKDWLLISIHKLAPELSSSWLGKKEIGNPRYTFFEVFTPQVDVVMVGDSLTEYALWNEIFPDIKIANRGVAGDTTSDIEGRLEPIYALNSKKAFLMMGTNDVLLGRSLQEVYASYLRIVDQLQQHHITPYIQSTLECHIAKCGKGLEKIRTLNQKLQNFAKVNGIAYIDVNRNLVSAQEGLLLKYTPDGIHLNGNGYFVWAQNIAYQIKSQ